MEHLSLDFADPILTANIYCAGFLDRLLCETIAPFWSRYKASDGDRGGFLWFARYQRGGEHLKIRFHGSAAARPFKLLHAHTNQLATGLLNEGYLCQLLIRICEEIWPETAAERRL